MQTIKAMEDRIFANHPTMAGGVYAHYIEAMAKLFLQTFKIMAQDITANIER